MIIFYILSIDIECPVWNSTVTVVESCLLSGWSFISSLIHRPDHVSPLKESQGIDLYTCWLLLTCHSRGVAWHSLAHCRGMCSLTLHAVHLVVFKHCSFRLCIIILSNLLCWSLLPIVNNSALRQDWIQWVPVFVENCLATFDCCCGCYTFVYICLSQHFTCYVFRCLWRLKLPHSFSNSLTGI